MSERCAIYRVFEYRTTVVVELYWERCPDCGIKAEKVPQLPQRRRSAALRRSGVAGV